MFSKVHLALIATLSLYSSFAEAQNVNNLNLLPLGDKESLMGNTGTGGVHSTGAVFYNPAALTQLEGNSFSLSGSAYLKYKIEAEPLYRFGNTDIDFTAEDYETVPTSVIMVRKVKDWKVGLSFMVPMEFKYEGENTWYIPTVNGENQKIKINQNFHEKMFLVGLSFARKLNNGWSVGGTFFAQNYGYLSSLNAQYRGTDYNLISNTVVREKLSPINLMFVAGLHKQWEKLSAGLRIATPSINIAGKGSSYRYELTGVLGNNIVTEYDYTDIKTGFSSPLDLRAGVTYNWNEKFTTSCDLSFTLPQEFQLLKHDSLNGYISSDGSFRGSFGIDYNITEKFTLLGGGSYFNSYYTSDEIDNHLDFVSGFVGVKMVTNHIETSLGYFYSKGFGEAVSPSLTSNEYYEYTGIFLGTNYKF